VTKQRTNVSASVVVKRSTKGKENSISTYHKKMTKKKLQLVMPMTFDLISEDSFILKSSILFFLWYQQVNDNNRLFNKYKKKKIRLLF